MAKLEPTSSGYYLWNYVPSIAAAVIFILIFLVLTALIVWRMLKTKTWFCIAFTIGGFFEFVGYCARVSSAKKTSKIMPFAIQNGLILLGPALFAASIYMCLSRIIRSVSAEHLSLIRPRILTKTFVIGDILSLVVQGGAAGLMVTGRHAKLAEGVVITGLMIQIIMFGLFMVTAFVFKKRISTRPTIETIGADPGWESSLRMLFIVSILIMVRSIFRVVEYASGHDGYLLQNEWPMYVFDSILMVGVMGIYYQWYPTSIVVEKGKGNVVPINSY